MDAIHTQATNFADLFKTGVDARTGQFTMAFQLPLIPANHLAGPSLSPILAFSVLGSTRNRGFGLGWSLDLSELHLHQDTASLRLSSGEQFSVDMDTSTFSPGSELVFFDMKLKSMVVTCQSEHVIRLDHKSGQTELLTRQPDSHRFLISEIRSPEGRRLFVDWSAFSNDDFILDRVRDENGVLMQVESDEGEVRFVVPRLKTDALRLQLTNDKLSDVYLPGVQTPFSIIYAHHPLDEENHLLLPTELTSPLGSSDAVVWGTGEYGHQLPDGAPFAVLPRVLEWTHACGTPETGLTRTYQWSGVHNFLGYGSDQAFDWQRGRDNLYDVEQDYDYEVVETQTDVRGKTLASITRTWNRFHLLVREFTRSGNCEVRTETTYGIEPDTPWDEQPAWCQLPHKQVVTYVDHSADNLNRSQQTEYRYDTFANVLFTRSPSGVEEHSEYYPADGEQGCPANPLGMVRYLKKKTIKPARLEDGSHGGASEMSTAYTYTSLASLIEDAPPCILVSGEHAYDETNGRAVETTTQTYVAQSGPFHARPKSSITRLNGKDTTTTYRYEQTEAEFSTYVTVSGFENAEQTRMTQSSARSLTTGRISRQRNLAGVLSRYTHDSLGRITLAVTADDSRYRATCASTYHVKDRTALEHRTADENPVMIEHTHTTGQRRRHWLDGEGRTVRVELEDIDHAPGVFREILRTVFDAQGQVTREIQTDWLRDEKDPAIVTALELCTTTHYDGWGQVRCIVTPDGVQTHTEHDPVKLIVRQWQQSGDTRGPTRYTHLNLFGSPVREQLYDANDVLVRSTELVRDGLDRVTQTRLKAPGQPDRVTTVRRDVYARIVEQQLPDSTRVNWTYASHSDDHHPESVAVTPPAR